MITPTRPTTGYFTSFETGQPQPDWSHTVEVDPTGTARCHGLDGAMTTSTAAGPAESPTAKPGVGYSGLRCLELSGSHAAQGHAFAYNKVLETSIPVTAATELSYLIFPQYVDDVCDPSTFVAVDLAFTDGSYLSELEAVDQHGARLSPQGQGESKTLYTQQWNRKASRIGAAAAGKTIARILVGYDNPAGPTRFAAFIDDISIAETATAPPPVGPSEWVVTTRGTHSSFDFSRGNNFPATAVPHGFNFYTPLTHADSTSWLYQYHRANNADNRPTLQALAVSHEPSPWMGDRQTFQVMPSESPHTPDPDRAARAMPFGHEAEIARPYHYGVTLDSGMTVDIAPTDHCAVFRFGFTGDDANLIFDNATNDSGLDFDLETGIVTGYSDVKSRLSTGATRMFVYASFDRPVTGGGHLGGSAAKGYLRFDSGTDRIVHMRLATSLLSVAQAKRNLDQEIGDASFDEVVQAAKSAWDAKLGIIEVEGATDDQLTTLYSNMYRLFLYPNSGHENTGTAAEPDYRYASPFRPPVGLDTPTATGAAIVEGQVYVNNGFWDTYRTAWPAYALLTPGHAATMIDGFVQQYLDGGWISRWSSPGYADLMTGTSSDVAFADAYIKGVTGFNAEAAYEAAVKNATVVPVDPGVGRKGMATSIFTGYTNTDTPEGLSWALEGYLNDFGIAAMSKALYDADPQGPKAAEYRVNQAYFHNRAKNYVHMFDPEIGYFQGRRPDGGRRVPAADFNPDEWGHDYTETNAWNTAYSAVHDGQGLANLYGGRQAMSSKLDEFFATPETADPANIGSYDDIIHEMTEARDLRMGMYGHSNQPSHHIPWMYGFVEQPWKTQALTREVVSRLYLGSEIGQGYPGDEDNGEMSAWWLFAALGLYPLQMGTPRYAIGSPLFTRAVVHLESGADLVINAPQNSASNVYVQGLRVNGEPYEKSYLDHATLAQGAVLDFEMGPQPSGWATGPDAVPPSITSGDAVAQPLADLTSMGEVDLAALFDDTSVTQYAAPGPWLPVDCRLAEPALVRMYTLTSAAARGGDPTHWVLKGSADGKNWTTVDERSGEVFPWRRQTRVFEIADPGEFTHYRLEINASTGAMIILSQVELLG